MSGLGFMEMIGVLSVPAFAGVVAFAYIAWNRSPPPDDACG